MLHRFLLLSVLLPLSLSIPDGFITFFESDTCPDGWFELDTAQGRLIVSVSDPEQAGVTVNSPLGDQEDRVHTHTYETQITLNEKKIAAIGCCNNQGAHHGDYPISGKLNSSTSGLPFIQLILCQISGPTLDEVPFGTIAYFSPTVSECPANWKSFDGANGRFIIPGYSGEGVIPSQAEPLSSGQDLLHSHTFQINITTNEASYEGADGCCNSGPAADGSYTVNVNGDEASSGIPYIQLLTCVSQEPTFNSSFPAGTLLYNEVGCTNGWNSTNDVAGRFVVALPENGVPGATFGTNSLRPGESDSPAHYHTYSGTVTTQSTGVGLASGCCGGGYVMNQAYYFDGDTTEDAVNLPYMSVPMCIQFGDRLPNKRSK